jgi:3-phosphoshikimate 1-carboxyvinyltransferase
VTRFDPSAPLRGALQPPPDKSISHRAALIAAMGEGETTLQAYLDAADTRSTLAAVERLGAEVERLGAGVEAPAAPMVEKRHHGRRNPTFGGIDLRIRGVGLRGPLPSEIDVGNAGTLLRILPGWLAGQGQGAWTLDGDESIRRRPVDRIAEPLARMGGNVSCRDGRLTPLHVEGADLHGITYELPVASAQVKSCVLLAGLLANGDTAVVEPETTRDHTERILAAAGASVETEPLRSLPSVQGGRRRISVSPVERLEPGRIEIPGDFSSAAFPLLAALLVRGSELRIEGVGLNPTRIGMLGVLNRMGAPIEVAEERLGPGGEPSGAIVVRHGPLEATRVHRQEVPVTIDELPLVALVGCFAEGETVVAGAEELRHKESDRIATVVDGLTALGADIEATDDGFRVRGPGGLRGGTFDAAGDHRLAMLGAVAGLASKEGVEVVDMDAAAVSYPRFESDLRSLL